MTLFDLLHKFNNNVVIDLERFGIFTDREIRKDVIKHLYKDTSVYFKYLRCGQITSIFSEILRRYGYNHKTVLIWNGYLANTYDVIFNYGYIDSIINQRWKDVKSYEDQIIFDSRKRGSHAVIEMEDKRIVDPMIGIVYITGIEDLIKGNGVYDSWSYNRQYNFFRSKYTHWGMLPLLFHTTIRYWNSVTDYFYKDYSSLLKTEYINENNIDKFCKEIQK